MFKFGDASSQNIQVEYVRFLDVLGLRQSFENEWKLMSYNLWDCWIHEYSWKGRRPEHDSDAYQHYQVGKETWVTERKLVVCALIDVK